ncbi:hypothetical protein W01_02420 [Candidatus Nitrotoga sp. AM1P]|nr:hypothetical protein W01_02420 [Candidatus Nitrotoga sp. AM1P]
MPHSCGNRHCPHWQVYESQRWIDKQLQKLVPGEYFMVTFTLPAQFRALVWRHQRELYELISSNAWATVNTFSQNDKKLRGTTGAVTVLHTHNRRLDFHPHVHLVMTAVAFDARQRLWRNKNSGYLFCHKALAKLFRARILGGIKQAGLKLTGQYPEEWGGALQGGEFGAEGIGVSGAVFISRGIARKEHRCKPRWQRHVPLPEQRNPQDGNAYPERRDVPAHNPAASPAKGIQAGAQFRFPAGSTHPKNG